MTWAVLDNGKRFVVRHANHPDCKRLRILDELESCSAAEKLAKEATDAREEREELIRRGQQDLFGEA